ncbi:MAG: hypothetical protein IJR00_06930 [Lachnospiraceae bacterium]|nr:hypothetical protein [Lachnospiraceae bacterium]
MIDGIFYFKSADIDVFRAKNSYGVLGFGALYGADNNYNYSEQIRLNSGFETTTKGFSLFLPGGEADNEETSSGAGNQNNQNRTNSKTHPGYKSIVKTGETDGQTWYRIEPQDPEVKDNQYSIYSGFLAAIDNKKGAHVTVWSSGGGKDNKGDNVSVETYLLAGNAGGKTTGTWYNLKSSTETIGGPYPDTGGTIQTTSWGNESGTLALGDRERLLGPTTLTVSGGKTITYTLTPEVDNGYVLKQLIASDGTIIYNNTGSDDVPIRNTTGWTNNKRESQPLNGGQKEELSYTVSNDTHPVTGEPKSYTFTFKNVQQDHAIHVVWQKKYYETYEFKMDDGSSVPAEVTALLPERATAGKEKRFWEKEPIAPASPWDHVNNVPKDEVIVTDGATKYKYSFLRYEDNYSPSYTYTDYNHGSGEYYTTGAGGAPAPRSTVRQNIHFTGYWKKTPAYTESYSYNQYLDEDNNPKPVAELPSEVTDTKPDRAEWYADGETVIPANPTKTKVTHGGFDYVFRGWDKDFAIVNGADVAFAGKWKRVAAGTPTFTEKYVYQLRGGGDLPDAVKDTLPLRAYQYFNHETVSAANPRSALAPDEELRVTVDGVTYVFRGWENNTAEVKDGDVKFVGIWEVLHDPQPQPQPQPDPDPQPQPQPDPDPQPQPDPAPTPAPQPEPAPAPAATPVNVTVDPPLGAVPYADVNLTQVNAPQTGTDLQILPELLLLTTSVGGVIRFRKKRKR